MGEEDVSLCKGEAIKSGAELVIAQWRRTEGCTDIAWDVVGDIYLLTVFPVHAVCRASRV